MSYAFEVTGATKEEAIVNLAVAFDSQVLVTQPIHNRDRTAALNAAQAFVDLLGDVPEGMKVAIYLCGSVSWAGAPDDIAAPLHSASVNINAYFRY